MARTESTELGMNKTAIGTAPILSKEMIESSRTGPVSPADSNYAGRFRSRIYQARTSHRFGAAANLHERHGKIGAAGARVKGHSSCRQTRRTPRI
ncbi:MAG: hypothetical protein K0Q83_269 [Deltaproteobacteria bacterium]|jgi:hypothetical protein|nr:hypothetical protein [Deltaproteobacteria bacterium]